MAEFEQSRVATPLYEQSAGRPKAWGPTIGLIVILLLIVIGSLYFFRNDRNAPYTNENSANDLNSIEADLNGTDYIGIDNGVNSAELEINQI